MLIPTLLLALLAQVKTAEGTGVTELRFHRVHLRNGNFIDGELVRQNTREIVLRLKSGEMGVRRDQIVRVELIKMRGLQDKPEELAQPKPAPLSLETPAGASTARKPAPPRPAAQGAYKASEALKAQVDPLLEGLEKAAPEAVDSIIQRLVALEEDAHAYLASQLEVASRTLLPLIGSVLSRTKSPAAAPYLARLVTHESVLVRLQAVTGLATNGDSSDAKAVAGVLKDKDAGLRGAAITTLRAIGEADAFDAIAPLCADADRETRGRALSTLATLALKFELREPLLRTLIDALGGANPDQAVDLIGALATTKDTQACPALAAQLGHDRPDVRAAAANGLGQIGSPDSADEIEASVAREEDAKVRAALAQAAARVKATGAMEGLSAWLDDENEQVKLASHAALKALSGTDLGLERAKWDAWIESKK